MSILIPLAVVLPVLAFLSAQFAIGCSEGECSWFNEMVGSLVFPLLACWLLVIAVLAVRAVRLVRRRLWGAR